MALIILVIVAVAVESVIRRVSCSPHYVGRYVAGGPVLAMPGFFPLPTSKFVSLDRNSGAVSRTSLPDHLRFVKHSCQDFSSMVGWPSSGTRSHR